MAFVEDFRKFALKGNVVDLAVGVIIGAAFGKIVSALVADLVMPLVALVMPSGDWRMSGIVLRHGLVPKDDVVLRYGDLIGSVVDFLIIALVLFVIVSKIVKAAESRLGLAAAAATKPCPHCLTDVPLAATRCKACTADLGKGL